MMGGLKRKHLMMGGPPPYLLSDSQAAPAPSSREVKLEAGWPGDEARAQGDPRPAIPASRGLSQYSLEACGEDVTRETKLDSDHRCGEPASLGRCIETPFSQKRALWFYF